MAMYTSTGGSSKKWLEDEPQAHLFKQHPCAPKSCLQPAGRLQMTNTDSLPIHSKAALLVMAKGEGRPSSCSSPQ
eukprot:scaffold99584_cov19-Tisochrysis_lutea.AAC.1